MIEGFKAKLIEKTNLAPNIWLLKFSLENKTLNFLAGQFLQLKIGDQRRCYSIASPEYVKDSFELLIRFVPGGLASTFFQNLKIGEMADFFGPYGVFTLKTKEKDKIFIAGGTGISPIRSQILTILKEERRLNMFLFWGLKSKAEIYFFEEFKKISEKDLNFHFKICLDQEKEFSDLSPKYFFKGRVQGAMLDFLEGKDLNSFEYYLCGPPPMVEDLKEFLSNKGVERENIILERF